TLGMGEDHVLLHVLGVRARVADPVDPVDRVDGAQQLGERALLFAPEVAAVAVYVLAEERHLPDALRGQPPDLLEDLAGSAARLPPPGRRHDAIGAGAIAALGYLHPGLERAGATRRKVAGEVLELEVALGADRVAGQELRQLVDLPRP